MCAFYQNKTHKTQTQTEKHRATEQHRISYVVHVCIFVCEKGKLEMLKNVAKRVCFFHTRTRIKHGNNNNSVCVCVCVCVCVFARYKLLLYLTPFLLILSCRFGTSELETLFTRSAQTTRCQRNFPFCCTHHFPFSSFSPTHLFTYMLIGKVTAVACNDKFDRCISGGLDNVIKVRNVKKIVLCVCVRVFFLKISSLLRCGTWKHSRWTTSWRATQVCLYKKKILWNSVTFFFLLLIHFFSQQT